MENQLLPATQVRGSNDHPNFILIQDQFYKVHPELVSYDFLAFRGNNILFIGYSEPLKAVCVKFGNANMEGSMFIYRDVPKDVWDKRSNYPGAISAFYTKEIQIQGYSCLKVDYLIQQATHRAVYEHLQKIEYEYTITRGLWATDQPEKVSDPENLLFQIN